MKITKLMLSALVAAATLVACNKEDIAPVQKSVKSIEVKIGNKIMTKGDAGTKIEHGTPVKVNTLQIFLTDASYSTDYTSGVKDNDGNDADFYWSAAEMGEEGMSLNFHYVSHSCTKVVAIANAGQPLAFEDVFNADFNTLPTIDLQQDSQDLLLFADADLSKTDRVHEINTEEVSKYAEVYEAALVLTPTIARFEVDGFVMTFADDTKISEVKVTDIAFQDYYPMMTAQKSPFKGVAYGTPVKPMDITNDAEVYEWFNDADNAGWFRDSFEATLTPEDGTKDVGPYAYHFYAGDLVPDLVIKLMVDNIPAYLATDVFYTKNDANEYVALTSIEAGKIYRMSAAGEELEDGSIPFDEDDLNTVDRCLEIIVDVIDWTVVLVTPDFGSFGDSI
ncbi:MAG: hypothetical protein IJ971_11140 [Bacteroidales bacterium]|nr:hypothetical protein [Bacteroidales bacterium]